MKKEKGEIKGELLLVFLIIAIIAFVAWFIITKKPLPFQKAKIVPNSNITNVVPSTNEIDGGNNDNPQETTSSSTSPSIIASAIGGHSAYTDTSAKYRVLSRERFFTLELTQKGKVYITMTKEQQDQLEDYGIIAGPNLVGLKLGEKNEIEGVSGKIVDMKFGRFGDSTKDSALIFLLEDGTVEYTEFYNLIGNCTSEGKIKDLKNIVKLQNVVRVYEEDEDRDSIVAIDSQNNVYDIGEILGL